ncbi:MAG: sugar transferase [Sedimentisphaerales bacterium]|jgi:lipopolysaccharide/colanic/teichoic acid biosynthesis glycosyltransferase|nr:sugar transferase [Sedimentisphaerales bacterium]
MRPVSSDVSLRIPILDDGQAYQAPAIQELSIRVMDIVLSVLILAIAWPAMLVLAVLIKITSPGPAIYKQKRVGKNGKIFMLYKFRSMVPDAEKHTGPVLASPNDGRVTSIGRFMRRTRLDELPQLFNVLKGDMGLVGPRPERPCFVYRHKALQGIRLSVRPGITGLAQVRGAYDLRPEHKLRYDYLYIRNRSVWLNLGILARTVPVVIRQLGR